MRNSGILFHDRSISRATIRAYNAASPERPLVGKKSSGPIVSEIRAKRSYAWPRAHWWIYGKRGYEKIASSRSSSNHHQPAASPPATIPISPKESMLLRELSRVVTWCRVIVTCASRLVTCHSAATLSRDPSDGRRPIATIVFRWRKRNGRQVNRL